MIIISLELILTSLSILFIHYSFNFDDLIGTCISLLIIPLAGAESALALILLIKFYPLRGT